MTGWRDIETAPKDGTEVLLFGKALYGREVMKVCWWSNRAAWQIAETVSGATPIFNEPTHWMPLPQPPEPRP
jgi:hypothetical protein